MLQYRMKHTRGGFWPGRTLSPSRMQVRLWQSDACVGLQVSAVAYDNPIPGFQTNNTINLRLWAAKPDREFDLQAFNTGDYVQVRPPVWGLIIPPCTSSAEILGIMVRLVQHLSKKKLAFASKSYYGSLYYDERLPEYARAGCIFVVLAHL